MIGGKKFTTSVVLENFPSASAYQARLTKIHDRIQDFQHKGKGAK